MGRKYVKAGCYQNTYEPIPSSAVNDIAAVTDKLLGKPCPFGCKELEAQCSYPHRATIKCPGVVSPLRPHGEPGNALQSLVQ